MGYTNDGFPFVGDLPDKPGQYICAGFNGHGMPQVFLSAKAIASMVVDGIRLEATDLPRLYRSSRERLESRKEHVSRTAYDAAMKQLELAEAKL
jgi:glycine/D-amino acid oxidase-like deaminating enzyme